MSLLLDTHALLWWLADAELTDEARHAIADPDRLVAVSAASIWEIAIKREIGKLDAPDGAGGVAEAAGFDPLGITFAHAAAAGALPPHHRDPFDRMLVAQARIEGLTIMTRDLAFAGYDVEVMVC